jgi:hypothetical protein
MQEASTFSGKRSIILKRILHTTTGKKYFETEELINITAAMQEELSPKQKRKMRDDITKICHPCWHIWNDKRTEEKRKEEERHKERERASRPQYWEIRLPETVAKLVDGIFLLFYGTLILQEFRLKSIGL